jgi:hypothetical protein
VLAELEGDTFALREDVRLERAHLRIVVGERLPLDRILDAPVERSLGQSVSSATGALMFAG